MSQANKSAGDIVVAALYQFVKLSDYRKMQAPLLAVCQAQQIKGTILLAAEGLNGTIAGRRQGIDTVLAYLRKDARLAALQHKESYTDTLPFLRMKVRLKKEIVTLGVAGIDPTVNVGTYVKPTQWNALISDPDVLVIDTRNDYECEIGTFQGALNPHTESFRQFPNFAQDNLDPARHKKVAMFCTGGIRCEKATAYLLQQGFEHVYHLQGGILKYLEEIPQTESLWRGECFVFDDRVAVDHGLVEGEYDQCHACRYPISAEDKSRPEYQPGVSCPRCHGKRSAKQVASAKERQKQMELAKQRKQTHLGARPGKRSD